MSENKFCIPSGAGPRPPVSILSLTCPANAAAPLRPLRPFLCRVDSYLGNGTRVVRVHAPTNLSVFMPRNCRQLQPMEKRGICKQGKSVINLVAVGDPQPSLSASRDKRFLVIRAPSEMPSPPHRSDSGMPNTSSKPSWSLRVGDENATLIFFL